MVFFFLVLKDQILVKERITLLYVWCFYGILHFFAHFT